MRYTLSSVREAIIYLATPVTAITDVYNMRDSSPDGAGESLEPAVPVTLTLAVEQNTGVKAADLWRRDMNVSGSYAPEAVHHSLRSPEKGLHHPSS